MSLEEAGELEAFGGVTKMAPRSGSFITAYFLEENSMQSVQVVIAINEEGGDRRG